MAITFDDGNERTRHCRLLNSGLIARHENDSATAQPHGWKELGFVVALTVERGKGSPAPEAAARQTVDAHAVATDSVQALHDALCGDLPPNDGLRPTKPQVKFCFANGDARGPLWTLLSIRSERCDPEEAHSLFERAYIGIRLDGESVGRSLAMDLREGLLYPTPNCYASTPFARMLGGGRLGKSWAASGSRILRFPPSQESEVTSWGECEKCRTTVKAVRLNGVGWCDACEGTADPDTLKGLIAAAQLGGSTRDLVDTLHPYIFTSRPKPVQQFHFFDESGTAGCSWYLLSIRPAGKRLVNFTVRQVGEDSIVEFEMRLGDDDLLHHARTHRGSATLPSFGAKPIVTKSGLALDRFHGGTTSAKGSGCMIVPESTESEWEVENWEGWKVERILDHTDASTLAAELKGSKADRWFGFVRAPNSWDYPQPESASIISVPWQRQLHSQVKVVDDEEISLSAEDHDTKHIHSCVWRVGFVNPPAPRPAWCHDGANYCVFDPRQSTPLGFVAVLTPSVDTQVKQASFFTEPRFKAGLEKVEQFSGECDHCIALSTPKLVQHDDDARQPRPSPPNRPLCAVCNSLLSCGEEDRGNVCSRCTEKTAACRNPVFVGTNPRVRKPWPRSIKILALLAVMAVAYNANCIIEHGVKWQQSPHGAAALWRAVEWAWIPSWLAPNTKQGQQAGGLKTGHFLLGLSADDCPACGTTHQGYAITSGSMLPISVEATKCQIRSPEADCRRRTEVPESKWRAMRKRMIEKAQESGPSGLVIPTTGPTPPKAGSLPFPSAFSPSLPHTGSSSVFRRSLPPTQAGLMIAAVVVFVGVGLRQTDNRRYRYFNELE